MLLTPYSCFNFDWCSWIEENNQRKVDILAAQMRIEQLQLRDQLLTAQNEMLKVCGIPHCYFNLVSAYITYGFYCYLLASVPSFFELFNFCYFHWHRWTRPISKGRSQNWMRWWRNFLGQEASSVFTSPQNWRHVINHQCIRHFIRANISPFIW